MTTLTVREADVVGDLYIICASAELGRAKAAHAHARVLGLVPTFDWPAFLQANLDAGRTDATVATKDAAAVAIRNLDGVALARVVVFLAPAPATVTHTAYGELGLAAHMTPIVQLVVSRELGGRRSFLEACAQHVVDTDREAIILARRLVPPLVTERP